MFRSGMDRKQGVWVLVLIGVLLLSMAGCAQPVKNPEPAKTSAPKTISQDMSGYYVDSTWLKQNLDKTYIIDARTDKEYNAGHIPGAVNITWQALSNMEPKQGEPGWGVVLSNNQLAAKLGEFGINGAKPIVVYNDPVGFAEDGRVVWMLRIAGLNDSRMLYGGWPAWKTDGGDSSKDTPAIKPVRFKITAPDESRLATTAYIKANRDQIKLVDARSPEEFNGKTNHGEKKMGHIPGAIHIHYRDTYTDDGYVKSIPELKAMFAKAGLKPEDDIVTYCTVGIRSGYLAEVLRMCGYEKAKNYNASFSEWSGDDANPVEK